MDGKLDDVQKKYAERVVLKDLFLSVERVGGVDEAFLDQRTISAVIVCDQNLNILDEAHIIKEVPFPYIPGYLMFREGPSILSVLKRLKIKPDVLFVNGCGINHPRSCGLATYVGVESNIPTIGVTRRLLCGEVKDGEVWFEGKMVGFEIRREGFAPIYAAPGNGVSLKSTVRITERFLREHRFPEPLFLAHKKANEIASRMAGVHQ